MIHGLTAKIAGGTLVFILGGLCALVRTDAALINEVSHH